MGKAIFFGLLMVAFLVCLFILTFQLVSGISLTNILIYLLLFLATLMFFIAYRNGKEEDKSFNNLFSEKKNGQKKTIE